MKKIILILILFLFLFLLSSCIFWPGDGPVKFKEEINHKLLWKINYSTEHMAIADFHHFDGQYFYFGLWNFVNDTCGVVKYDLNGNNVWGKIVNLTDLSQNSEVKEIHIISKIENKLYILTTKGGIYGMKNKLIMLNADTGQYLGIYNLDDGNRGASCFKPSSYENIVYIALNIVSEGLHIYCFDKNANSPVLINERFFPDIKAPLTASKFIHDGRMYFRGLKDGKEKSLIVMDCISVSDKNKTNEECIVKIIDGDYDSGACNNILLDNKVITVYTNEIIPNQQIEEYFQCYDINNNYSLIWEYKENDYVSPAWVDLQVYGNYFFVPAMNKYVDCYSITDGHLVWENDNSLYVNEEYIDNWNNTSTGAVIEGKWYAQPVYSGCCIILYDINTGKKVGRIEILDQGEAFAILTNEVCWAVGNKLYVIGEEGYFYCYEITGNNKSLIYPVIIIIFTTIILAIIFFVNKRRIKKIKAIKENIEYLEQTKTTLTRIKPYYS